MKNKFIILALILIIAGITSSTDIFHTQKLDQPQEQHKLVMGVSLDYPPFEFLSFGKPQGYDVDLAHLLAEELDLELELRDMDYNSLIAGLNTNKVDFVISAMSPSPTRAQSVDFSRLYYNAQVSLVVANDVDLEATSKFSNKTIGAQMGSSMEAYLKKKKKVYDNLEIVSLSKIPELVEELKNGRIDAILLDDPVAHKIISKNTGFKSVKINDFEEGYAVVLPLNSPLTAQINNALNKLEKEGKLQQLQEKWMTYQNNDVQ